MRILLFCIIALTFISCSTVETPPIVIQAEAFTRGTVLPDNTIHGYGEGIGVIVTPAPPGYAEYDIDILKTSNYKIELRYASALPRPVRLLIDGQLVTDRAAGLITGGFMPPNQQWGDACILSIAQGKHTLRLDSQGPFPCIDQIRITATTQAESKP
jgi:hypothetical protein